ncbi:MAG: phosphoribosylglycinamide formyltransferase [Bacteroidetes bacterium CG_4_10_14_3_um_filter_31_20]|nr:MAG: phosphoribosylglycinamide formyltransferase [Bacteroidetes bacterium CG_4_10_14_3_um_filter_31_20]
MTKIAVFASGSGTNAENIIKHFKSNNNIIVSIIFTNNQKAGVIERANRLNVPVSIFSKEDFYQNGKVSEMLKNNKIDFIVLSGFLWLVPINIIENFKMKIINIHPALLPKYGGKGMYGEKVHKTIIENGEKESGITIHYVNNKYDDGDIIFQAKCIIETHDTAESLANKIHKLEYEFYPKVIEKTIEKL